MEQKKGVTPDSNLVNLKSNTMKNTVQIYGFIIKEQTFQKQKRVI